MELVTWRGTPGVGDFMWALNCAHNYSYHNNVLVNLEMHWEHGEDYYHHFEDPETIIERMEYIHNFYHNKEDVKVTHVFNSQDRYTDWKYTDDLVTTNEGRLRSVAIQRHKARFWFESGAYSDEHGSDAPKSDWIFRRETFRPSINDKIVIWRPVFNAELPRTWKNFLTFDQWESIIAAMRQAGMNIVELSYRTPVSEAMYHISNCRMVVCYDGMWHYIARNFGRPMIVISTEGVTKYHTPHCLRVSPLDNDNRNIWWWLNNMNEFLGHPKKKAVNYREKILQYHEDFKMESKTGVDEDQG
jgi:hypothetical protein